MSTRKWFYSVDRQTSAGPVRAEDLQSLFDQGKISLETLVWSPGLGGWAEVKDAKVLACGLPVVPPPLPLAKPEPVPVVLSRHSTSGRVPLPPKAAPATPGQVIVRDFDRSDASGCLVALGLVVLVLLLGVAIAKGAGMPAMVLIVVAVLAVFGGGSVLLWLSSKANGTTAATAQQDARADQPTLPTESVKQ